jgi:hypothetical protein
MLLPCNLGPAWPLYRFGDKNLTGKRQKDRWIDRIKYRHSTLPKNVLGLGAFKLTKEIKRLSIL